MFVLVSIEDKIKVNPDLFDQDLTEVTDSDISYPLFSLPNL
jgi:DNA-directed RNA polymerase subunit E'/Rpb7